MSALVIPDSEAEATKEIGDCCCLFDSGFMHTVNWFGHDGCRLPTAAILSTIDGLGSGL